MSLIPVMSTGVNGLLSQAEGLTVIGNNISNVNTVGFKSGRTMFSDMLSTATANNSQIGTGVHVQKIDTLFSSGAIVNSNNVTDLAIQGNGFFVLGSPTAGSGTAVTCEKAYYTKAGAFRLDNTGLGLVNPDGYKLLDTAGMPIVFPATVNTSQVFQKVSAIDATGLISLLYADPVTGLSSTVYYSGNGTADADMTKAVRIAEARIPNPDGLVKQGGTLYTANAASSGFPVDSTGTPLTAGSPVSTSTNGTTERMLSNYLEQSNVDMATEFVNMITTQRAYSANSRTITTADEMIQEILNLKR